VNSKEKVRLGTLSDTYREEKARNSRDYLLNHVVGKNKESSENKLRKRFRKFQCNWRWNMSISSHTYIGRGMYTLLRT
jgi:hypothetical protein